MGRADRMTRHQWRRGLGSEVMSCPGFWLRPGVCSQGSDGPGSVGGSAWRTQVTQARLSGLG